MLSLPVILAAGSLPLIFGAPVPSDLSVPADVRSSHILSGRATNTYQTTFGGNGEGKDWPTEQQWLSFDDLWKRNLPMMTSSCPNTDADPTTDSEAADIKSSITEVSKELNVDKRVILVVIMQESNGCVRIKTTDNGVTNPGLMQSYNGKYSCNRDGNPESHCDKKTIKGMIYEGTQHLASECGNVKNGAKPVDIYRALRKYNSGSVDTSNLGKGLGSTACYVSDIVNRFLGWSSGPSSCTDSVSTLTGSSWSGAGSGGDSGDDSGDDSGYESGGDDSGSAAGDSGASTPAATAAPTVAPTENPAPTGPPQVTSEPVAPVPTTTAAPVTPTPVTPVEPAWTNTAPVSSPSVPAVPVPTQTPSPVQQDGSWSPSPSAVPNWNNPSPSPSAVPSAVPSAQPSGAPLYPGAVASCQQYNTIVDGDFCIKVNEKYGITEGTLRQLNSGLDEKCTNLWLGYQYCVKA